MAHCLGSTICWERLAERISFRFVLNSRQTAFVILEMLVLGGSMLPSRHCFTNEAFRGCWLMRLTVCSWINSAYNSRGESSFLCAIKESSFFWRGICSEVAQKESSSNRLWYFMGLIDAQIPPWNRFTSFLWKCASSPGGFVEDRMTLPPCFIISSRTDNNSRWVCLRFSKLWRSSRTSRFSDRCLFWNSGMRLFAEAAAYFAANSLAVVNWNEASGWLSENSRSRFEIRVRFPHPKDHIHRLTADRERLRLAAIQKQPYMRIDILLIS